MEKESYIEINPKIMMGKPVIKGTRITVELILERMSLGESVEELITAYPFLGAKKIQAALGYAALALRDDIIIASTT